MFKFDDENLLESLDLESDFDGDSCDIKTLKTMFSGQYKLEAETSVSMSRCFVLHISGSVSSNSKVVAALSNYSCAVYDVPHLTKLDTTSEHKGPVSGIKFSSTRDNLFYSCSLDGLIKLWDLRSGLKKSVQVFKDDTDGTGQPKPLRSFDIACNDRFVSAGTELVDGDAFLLFWDARSSNLLGGYWESHREEITQVRFHPSKCDMIATGSTDGLINIFDLSQGCEDDALLYSLNTEASVETLGWVTNDGAEDGLSCITQTEELQMWSIDGAAPNVHFTREDITKHIQRKSVEDCYLVNLHQNTSSRELFLIAGTTAQRGECLRTVAVKNNTLKPLSQFLENKQIVRTSWYDENNGMLVTGGESGLISLWKPSKSTLESSFSDRKMSSKVKEHHKHMPY